MKKVKDVEGCQDCPMRNLFPENVFVAPRIGRALRLAIGESPGQTEVETGEGFTGGSGNWLRGVKKSDGRRYGGFYAKAGVKDEDITFTNVIQCKPPGNHFPTSSDARSYISRQDGFKAVCHCVANHVEPLLKSRPWQRIDLLGDQALSFVGRRSEGIMKWRGSPIAIPAIDPNKIVAIPTLHPSYVARDQVYIPVVINDLRKTLDLPPERYNLYPTIEQVQAFNATEFCFDIETPKYREMGDAAPIELVGLCAKPYEVLVVPFTGAYKHELRRIFRNAARVIGQNCLQFDLPRLQRDDVNIGNDCAVYDTMLLQHLRFPNLPHDLEFIGSQFSNKPAWKHDKGSFELYCARDVDVTMQAYKQLVPMIEQAGLMDVYQYVQVPLAKICYEMHSLGFKQDAGRLKEVRTKFLAEMEALEKQLPDELRSREVMSKKRTPAPEGTLGKSGKPVKFVYVEVPEKESPWRSNQVKANYLYKTLGLPEQRHAKTGEITVAKEALDKLYGKTRNPVLKTIRAISKLGTLLSGFLKEDYELHPRRFIHPSYNPHGTATGRLSSSDPNFQNQPETARYLYVPRHADWSVIEADYSGIENRLMALFANDTERMARFDAGVHEHKYATSLFFGIPQELVEKDNDPDAPYNKAKHIVHGTDRGMGAKKISNMYGLEFAEAKRLQTRWKQEIQKTIDWQKQIADQADRQGWLANCFGRKAWFYTSSKYTESISFLPQATGADIIYRAMIGLMYERIGWPVEKVKKVVQVFEPLPKPANLLVQVHDSLVMEAPNELIDEVVRILTRVLCQPWPELGGYSFPIEVGVGPSWGECEPYKLRDDRVRIASAGV